MLVSHPGSLPLGQEEGRYAFTVDHSGGLPQATVTVNAHASLPHVARLVLLRCFALFSAHEALQKRQS